jgi:hypothetical protein
MRGVLAAPQTGMVAYYARLAGLAGKRRYRLKIRRGGSAVWSLGGASVTGVASQHLGDVAAGFGIRRYCTYPLNERWPGVVCG